MNIDTRNNQSSLCITILFKNNSQYEFESKCLLIILIVTHVVCYTFWRKQIASFFECTHSAHVIKKLDIPNIISIKEIVFNVFIQESQIN